MLKAVRKPKKPMIKRQRVQPPAESQLLKRIMLMALCLITGLCSSGVLLAGSTFSYNVSVEGALEREVRGLLLAVSATVALSEKPVASLNLLWKRVNQDIPRLLQALRSHGFYSASVTPEINADKLPAHVVFRIDPGPPYLLTAANIQIAGEDSDQIKLPEARDIGLKLGEPALSKSILDAENKIVPWLRKKGYPFAIIGPTKIIVDHAGRTVSVTFHVQSGLKAKFGRAEIRGLESVKEAFVRRKIKWQQGDQFNDELLKKTRDHLAGAGLFANVQVKTGERLDEIGELPVIIEIKERKHHTVKAGGSYRTDEGIGSKISWEHRNFFGSGEQLSLSGIVSETYLGVEEKFRKLEFLRPDQALLFSFSQMKERQDAYIGRGFTSMMEIERWLSKEMELGVGLAFSFSQTDQLGEIESFRLIYLPARFDWDTSDNILDPEHGGRLNLQLAPYYDTYDENLGFVKGYFAYRRYAQISERPFLTLAARGTLGVISGNSRDGIPADKRFYAGGGGSIRGYSYQSVGPLSEGEPIGGRSLLGLSWELRTKVSDDLGLVIFLDGGSAFEEKVPTGDEKIRWGTGLGFRYFTRVGPLRLDIGVPLNRRKDIDDPVQVYVSLGQAF
ncbi:MAG: hypothetical protein AUJ48_00420 [Deltaproteobacteria bacterium CG1_02_45_11]|nr:MAG: hypothetical protein AUJ48_00420 [Deltaproteobacteria bacterium CG1_02_45_11]